LYYKSNIQGVDMPVSGESEGQIKRPSPEEAAKSLASRAVEVVDTDRELRKGNLVLSAADYAKGQRIDKSTLAVIDGINALNILRDCAGEDPKRFAGTGLPEDIQALYPEDEPEDAHRMLGRVIGQLEDILPPRQDAAAENQVIVVENR
jgi:hypothetical protein